MLLEVNDVKKHFPVTKGLVWMRVTGWIKAVDGVSFAIKQGETLGLVGESGCGKTTTGKLILRMEEPTSGFIRFEGRDTWKLSGTELTRYRDSVQAVFQDSYSSLNPRMRVGDIIAEPLVVNGRLPGKAAKERVAQLLEQVGLNADSASLYPHEFSGGQRQRISIATAFAVNPRLVVLDEPVSALDVAIRAQLLNLLKDLQEQLGLTYLLIAHDPVVVEHMSTRICVMYLGKVVENVGTEEFYAHPLHPYTIALLSAALPSQPDAGREEVILPGEVPSSLTPPSGCSFHPRCSYALPCCREAEPPLAEVRPQHWVACHLHTKPS